MTAPVGRADLHVHALPSVRAELEADVLLAGIAAANLDVVAITEHDRVDLGLSVRELVGAAGLSTAVVTGSEITSSAGHVLGLWIEHDIEPGLSLIDTIAAVHEADGVAVVAHPLLPVASSVGRRALRAALQHPDPRCRPDGIEVHNAVAAGVPLYVRGLRRIAQRSGVAIVGGSDAHSSGSIGKGLTLFPGRSADDLRTALFERHTAAAGGSEHLLKYLALAPRRFWNAARRQAAV